MEKILEPGDIVLCTVDRIVGTNVFVKMKLQDKELEGYIVMSEIAAGRIRNLRDYVVPNKKILCKVLRVDKDRIELSLRRVTKKEEQEFKERYAQERSYENVLKIILGEKSEVVINEIRKDGDLYDFFEGIKTNPKRLEELVGEKDAKKIIEILLKVQKQKKVSIKKEILVTSTDENGLEKIKNLFSKVKDIDIKYLARGRYLLIKESNDPKTSENELKKSLELLEKESKNLGVEVSILKK
ncbi:MAG: hypothetical protein QXU40_00420 [Candidatus Pacearchaeota archaeon]